ETDRRCRDDQRAEVAEAGSGAALLARRQRRPHILDRLDALQLVDLDRLGGSLFPQAGHDPGQAAGGCGDSEGESEANVVVGGEDHLLAFDPEVESVGLGAHFDFRERPGPNLGAPGGEEGEGFVLQMDPHGDAAGVVAGHPHRPGHPRVDHWSAPGRPRPPVEGADRIRTDRRCGQQLWRMSGRGLYPRHVPEIIYTTYRLSRHYPPDRTVLSDISLSFYYGAKIGVIGPNGAGKSSLLRIMAGLDDGYEGEARLTEGYTVGLLEQEPYLDPAKTVYENVMDGVAEVKALIDEYNEVLAAWPDPDADYEALGARQQRLEDKIAAADAWNLDRTVEMAMEALRVPPGDRDVTTLSGGERRRVALCRLLLSHPDLLLLDEPTNHLDA